MDNLVALATVSASSPPSWVPAAVWFYTLAALCVVYGLMRLSAAISEREAPPVATPAPSGSRAILQR